MPEDVRRFPALQKQVSKINETDVRISIIGTIIDKQNDFIMVDDSTGRIKISFQDIKFDLNQMVRVFGRVIPTPSGCELQGEVIQDMSKLDLSLFKKIQNLSEAKSPVL